MDRRNFVKTLAVVGTSTLSIEPLSADNEKLKPELFGILVDTSRCAGCQNCSIVCAETNSLPQPDLDALFDSEEQQMTSERQWTLINRYQLDDNEVYVKRQCMHCNQPACTSACLTKALIKTKEGPVIWREDKCMGCRFCMISCPFNIPKFEYNNPVPKIQKCEMCWNRLKDGEKPACVSECPEEALLFGKRAELIEEGRKRIYENPEQYVHHIYGEHEVGGTGVMYLAAYPFEKLGFRTDLGKTPYPEYTKTFLYSVPIIFTLWPAFLLALSNATKREGEGEE